MRKQETTLKAECECFWCWDRVSITQSLMVRTNFYIHEVFKFSQSHAALCLCIFYFLKWQAWPFKKNDGLFWSRKPAVCCNPLQQNSLYCLDLEASKNLFTVHSHHNNLPQSIFNRTWTFYTDKKKHLLDQSQSSRALTNVLANCNACVTSYQFNSELDLCLEASAINWAS